MFCLFVCLLTQQGCQLTVDQQALTLDSSQGTPLSTLDSIQATVFFNKHDNIVNSKKTIGKAGHLGCLL
jgi:hypothetical protein